MADDRGVGTESLHDGAEAAASPGAPVPGDGGPGLSGEGAAAGGRDAAGDIGDAASSPSADLELLQREIDGLNDRHLRLAAEFDNYRKRVERERADSRDRAQAELVSRLVDALDDFDRVVEVDPAAASVESVLEGAGLVRKKLRQSLESAGLKTIDPVGEAFDPASMEALMTVPAEHPDEDEVVADVLQKGYRFHDVLLRPARVRVKKYE